MTRVEDSASARNTPLAVRTCRRLRATRSARRCPAVARAAGAICLLVAFAVLFGAWLLRAEVRVAAFPNDATVHNAMSRVAELNIRAGHNPFDAWFPYLGFGVPQFSQYQSLPSILTGLLNIVVGASTFRWINYLLICTWPISVYIGARLLGFDRWEAGAASLFSPMLVNIKGYGFEWGSFVWLGSGMWSMLWALWLMPIALGLAWRAVSRGERIAFGGLRGGSHVRVSLHHRILRVVVDRCVRARAPAAGVEATRARRASLVSADC